MAWKHGDGKKLIPFFTKKYVVIPRNVEKIQTGCCSLIAAFADSMRGFGINKAPRPAPVLTLSELIRSSSNAASLFEIVHKKSTVMKRKNVFDLSLIW